MARVRIHDADDADWRMVREWTSETIRAQISDLELDSSIREHERGTQGSLQLFEVRFLPRTVVDVHAHDEEEVIYVVDGEMIVGARTLRPGSSIYVAGSTLYSFKAGPEGLRILNFRPRADTTYRTRESVLRGRTHAPTD